ncbi:hypothetical protein HC251_17190 [Iamia sp. SCSIO 61187]|uniref:hypothetical protein n=1 Tax=Iamia sp. SCSIO 61187 TaxID=2722752 RepID=UPI001C632C12|nr:hypothetical protein [Iamia sp. SCSIO 61187]QYG93999.1 hypothetical protein HC251_17190 [Iamia sp. SCSIO 61187]
MREPSATGPGAALARWAPLVAAAPILVATVLALREGWTPTSDQAGQVARIADVFTRRTPLVGPYSREGWSHPGPLVFWVTAPGYRLLGPAGIMATIGLVNAVSAATAVALARRVGGAALALAVTGGLLVAEAAIEAHGLVDVWNPYVGTIPLLVALLGLLAVAFGTDGALPVVVVAASWALQSHLGPVLVVLAATAATVAILAVRRHRPSGRWLAVAVGVGLLLWSGPIVDQLTADQGNLSAMVDYLRSPQELQDTSIALDVTADHLGIVPAWAGVGGAGSLAGDPRPWTLAVPVVGLLLAGLGARRLGDRRLGATVLVALVALVAAIGASTRIDFVQAAYLYRWTWAVGVLTWAVIATAAWRVVTGMVGAGTTRRVVPVLALGVVLVGVVVTGAVVADPDAVPLEGSSEAAADLLDQIPDGLPREGRYTVAVAGDQDLGAVATGLGVALDDAGYDIRFPPSFRDQMGDHRVTEDPSRQTLFVVATSTIDDRPPTPGATLLAVFDRLTPAERARIGELEDAVRDQVGLGPTDAVGALAFGRESLLRQGADRATMDALRDLAERGPRYTVWLSAPPPG